MGTTVVASSSSVWTLDIVLFTHREQVTNHPADGVQENHISVILAHNHRSSKAAWSVDCIDLGELDDVFIKAGRAPILEGIFRALGEHGINPWDVTKWSRFVNQTTLRQAMQSYERTGQVAPMNDYRPRRKTEQETGQCLI